MSYWGCNQYIIQRALAAKSVKETQRGLAFAGYLKILLPLIVVIPGIVAFQLSQGANPVFNTDEILYNAENNSYVYDNTYPWLLGKFVGSGLKGLAFAALVAAIVSSSSSMINSIATIFTMDIYNPYFDKTASEGKLVNVGRLASATSLLVAAFISPLLGTLGQAYQFIQEFTGLISPGITAIFLFGLFWKRATANSALTATVLSIPLSFAFKFLLPTVPFLNRMGIVLGLLCLIIIVMSLVWPNKKEDEYKNEVGMFHTGAVFNMLAIGIFVIVAFLYAMFW